ncbi:glycosyltransferase [Pseudarthrobacter sp. B4EP4b]|uniref:glycosyltransferase n=1 Tax=Pseudarthrobacter sp. B4EP4b TaxID=2590664 RepID=UPI00114DBED5
MRILETFCISEKVSGGELYVLELLVALQRHGWSCSIVTGVNSVLAERASSMGIQSRHIKLGPKLGKRTLLRIIVSWPIQLIRLQRHFAKSEAGVILLQYKLEQLLSAMLFTKKQTVMLEHGPVPSLITKIAPVRWLYLRALRRASLVLAASSPARESLLSLGVHSVPLLAGNDPKRVTAALESRCDHRTVLESYVGSHVVGVYAGRIVANKGVFDAVSLVAPLEGVGLVIFGEGPDADLLRARISDLPNVHFVGAVSDPLPYIAAADFGILMTKDPGEGRPLFGVECLSVGTPLIGAGGSPAIEGLVEEFGPVDVRVMNSLSSSELASYIQGHRAGSQHSRNWDDTASDFHQYLESAGL